MAIRRAKRRTNFTMISNVGLRDKNLSFKAKGLLAYMLSLPDDWVFYESEITKHAVDGKHSVRAGLQELEDNDYLIKNQSRDNTGKFSSVEWILHDEPLSENRSTEKPTTDKPQTDNPITENQPLLNTDSTKDLPKASTDETKDNVGQTDDVPYKTVVDYLNQAIDSKFKSTSEATKKLIKARHNEGFTLEDFKQVIDNKVADWKKDKKMAKFLRPQTLFGNKFEAYLNEKPSKKGGPGGGIIGKFDY